MTGGARQNLIRVLISQSYQRAIRLALFVGIFVVMLGLAAWAIGTQVIGNLRHEAEAQLAHYTTLRANISAAFEVLNRDVAATPCGQLFHQQLRKVAYLPDGLNEFMYFEDGAVLCSTNFQRFAQPISLGPPDIDDDNPFRAALWIDRSLDFVGLPGLTGTLARQGHFVVVVPPQSADGPLPRWMDSEVVLRLADGRWWHREGNPSLYEHHLADGGGEGIWPLHGDAFHVVACDLVGVHCVIAEASLTNLFAFGPLTVLVVLVVCAVAATWLASVVHALLRRYVAFEARFLRHFSPQSIHCHYQPILCLKTGRIIGVEALARWRDIDGQLVAPDRFLPVVEDRHLTGELTRYVVGRAASDLAGVSLPGRRLQVNINVVPSDLRAEAPTELFAPLLADPDRIALVVEIVETEAFDAKAAQLIVDGLRRAGIGVYLDDFGVGFSSIHTLAGLRVDGVKLDRAFAQAPEGSLLRQMLPNALSLLQHPGRVIVVEGVESEDRLAMLRATGHVDQVQGYLISRPLAPSALKEYLANHVSDLRMPRLVA